MGHLQAWASATRGEPPLPALWIVLRFCLVYVGTTNGGQRSLADRTTNADTLNRLGQGDSQLAMQYLLRAVNVLGILTVPSEGQLTFTRVQQPIPGLCVRALRRTSTPNPAFLFQDALPRVQVSPSEGDWVGGLWLFDSFSSANTGSHLGYLPLSPCGR
jgi:hypothetical protein